MKKNIWSPFGQFASFDYAKMARQAASQRDILQNRLKERKACGPDPAQGVRTWEWENRMIYSMYLEQRSLAKELNRRAGWT